MKMNVPVVIELFFEAANSGNVVILQRCLDHHHQHQHHGGVVSDVNVTNSHGQTALYRACLHGHLEVVQFLIQERGANVNLTTQNQQHYSCLQAASQEGHLNVLKLLLQTGGAHVNYQDVYGESALHDAIHYNQISAAKLLLDHGADLRLPNNQGVMPIDYAVNDQVKQYLYNYNPIHNLIKKLDTSNQQVHELRQEVHMLKNLLLVTAFGNGYGKNSSTNNMTRLTINDKV